jgi:hypothetical protein
MTLTDRYIAATIAHLPLDQREEVQAELQASIADAVDAYPGEQASAEKTVLEDLGDPERLAATYSNRPLALIGPTLYLAWKRLLKLLLWIVVPIIAVLAGVGSAVAGDGPASVLASAIGAGIGVGINMTFAVTVIFALLERYGKEKDLADKWTIDDLTEPPQASVSGGETITSAVGLLIGAAFIVWQHVSPWTSTAEGEGLPILNPQLWSFVLPAVLVVMAVELVTVVMRHARGRWTMRDWWATVVLNIVTMALLLPPLLQGQFLNRELFAEIGWPDSVSPISLETAELITAAIVVVAALSDVIPAWRKARSGSRAT